MKWKRPKPASSSPFSSAPSSNNTSPPSPATAPRPPPLPPPPVSPHPRPPGGGDRGPREPGRYEIPTAPAIIRERERQITGRDRRNTDPVLRRYERICFEKQHVR